LASTEHSTDLGGLMPTEQEVTQEVLDAGVFGPYPVVARVDASLVAVMIAGGRRHNVGAMRGGVVVC